MTTRVCNVALMYPRGEVPFISEWLEYHLILGVDHTFLGLHVTDDLVDPSTYLNPRRPTPAMYDMESTEVELLEHTLELIRPFGARVTPYIVLRTDPHYMPAQRRFLNAVFGLQRHNFDWVGVHDIDEYLVPQDEFRTIKAALTACPDAYDSIQMEQAVVEPRWDHERRPRPAPLIVPELQRCAEIVPHFHGMKSITRCRSAAAIGVHYPQLVVGARPLADRRLLTYHFRGFTDAGYGYRVPIEHQVYDMTDDRPWSLLHSERATASRQ